MLKKDGHEEEERKIDGRKSRQMEGLVDILNRKRGLREERKGEKT